MERILLYWDDLDDLVGAVGLVAERIRRVLLVVLVGLAYALTVAGGIVLALVEPPLAMAAATLMLVTLMYRSVTTSRFRASCNSPS